MADVETPVVLEGVTKKFRTTTAVKSLDWAPKRGQVTALGKYTGSQYAGALAHVFVPFLIIEAVALVFFLRRDVNN